MVVRILDWYTVTSWSVVPPIALNLTITHSFLVALVVMSLTWADHVKLLVIVMPSKRVS